jgi:hypothetical protein
MLLYFHLYETSTIGKTIEKVDKWLPEVGSDCLMGMMSPNESIPELHFVDGCVTLWIY